VDGSGTSLACRSGPFMDDRRYVAGCGGRARSRVPVRPDPDSLQPGRVSRPRGRYARGGGRAGTGARRKGGLMGGGGSQAARSVAAAGEAGSRGHAATYLEEAIAIAGRLDAGELEAMAQAIADLRTAGGRLFFLGVGGSAANASHATNDFRKLAGIESYCATDNVAELTARTNDDGWESTFVEFLRGSRLTPRDGL